MKPQHHARGAGLGTDGSGRQLALLVALMSMLAPFSIDTYLPSFPDIGAELGASHLQLQQTLSLYLFGFAGMTLLYGPLSDALGRRRVVLWSLFLYAASSVGCALAESFEGLLLFRIGQGVSAAGGLVIGRAVVRDVFAGPGAQRVMSRIMLLFAVAPAVAPILGGYLHDWAGWRSVFWFLALFGLSLWGVLVWRFPETLPPASRQSLHPLAVGRAYALAMGNGRFLAVVAVIALNFGGAFLYIAGAPELLYRHLGFGASDFGLLFVPLVAGMMGGAWISGRVAGRLEGRRTVGAGFALMGVAALANLLQALWLPPHPVTIIAPASLYAVGMSLAMPSLNLLALDHLPHNRGTASSVLGFFHTASNGVVAGTLVPVAVHSLAHLALAMAALLLAAWLVWVAMGTAAGGRASLDPTGAERQNAPTERGGNQRSR